MDIGRCIKELRKNKGLTLKQLSKMVGISVSFLSDIENGRSKPSLEKVRLVATGLGTTVSYLMGDADSGGTVQKDGTDSEFFDLLGKEEYRELREALKDLKYWNADDRSELLAYLRAKSLARTRRKI